MLIEWPVGDWPALLFPKTLAIALMVLTALIIVGEGVVSSFCCSQILLGFHWFVCFDVRIKKGQLEISTRNFQLPIVVCRLFARRCLPAVLHGHGPEISTSHLGAPNASKALLALKVTCYAVMIVSSFHDIFVILRREVTNFLCNLFADFSKIVRFFLHFLYFANSRMAKNALIPV